MLSDVDTNQRLNSCSSFCFIFGTTNCPAFRLSSAPTSVPSCNQLHLRQLPLLEHPLETQLASLSSPTSHIILFLIKQLDGLLDIEVDVLIGEAAAARAWWISEVGVCWKRSGCKMWIDDGRHIWRVDVGN
jgi:hypothetical protein